MMKKKKLKFDISSLEKNISSLEKLQLANIKHFNIKFISIDRADLFLFKKN